MNKTEKLRLIIRESIQEYIKEIDQAANEAAMDARITKCEEAIQMRETKLNNLKNLEEVADMLDEAKVKMMEKEINELKKAKIKFEKQEIFI
jgi:predicted proteasome-type protease